MTRRLRCVALLLAMLLPHAEAAVAQVPDNPGVTLPAAGVDAGSSISAAPHVTPALGAALKGLPKDIWRSVTFDTAKIAAVGLGASLVAHRTDRASLQEFQESLRFRDFVSPGNTYGSFTIQAGGAFGTYLIGRWTGNSTVAAAGLDIIRAQVVTQAWVQTLKFSINRRRPDGTPFSFPSGHVASSFATAAVVQRDFGWKAGLPFYGLGAYVASARIARNRHYMSDVLFGAAIGLASAHSLRIHTGRHTLAMSPGAVGPGIGVNFNLETHP